MNTTEQRNNLATDTRNPENSNQNAGDRNNIVSEELYENDELKQTNEEIADRGYTIRNGYDPNNPNPDQERITNDEDDLDDLDDDFHNPKDLEHDDEELEINDEFDNPSDDFNETEDDEDLENDDLEEEDDFEDVEIEEETEESYEENDPRKF
ncbi:hypothetical protein [Flavobacterium piscis]|uniref:DNA primase n=1 Tax=Flavobacterium piscis TaxID=1114874 RepID=A0ABU1Y9D5_9FLAO|nr:hypothetical protein [Flavobacterium piscis]MDR7210837.1 hypothetical protein [Flavobacterium piscis]